jgi:hypothetical protein
MCFIHENMFSCFASTKCDRGIIPYHSSEHTVCVLFTNIKCTIILFYLHVADKTLSTLFKKEREIQNNRCKVTVRSE